MLSVTAKDISEGESRLRFHIFRTPLAQSAGLMFRSQPPADCAYVFPIRRPQTIFLHTCFMRFTIDVTVLDVGGIVTETARMRPWRVRIFRHAATVIETAAGERGRGVWGEGERVMWDVNDG